MKWTSSITAGPDLTDALEQSVTRVHETLGSETPASLVVAFVSSAYGEAAQQVPGILASAFPRAVVFGCTAGGVIGDGQEIEGRPAVALTAGHLPNVRIAPFRVTAESCPTADDPPEAWTRLVGVLPQDRPSFLVLMDPFSPPGDQFPAGLDFAFPAATKAGGLASGGLRPGAHMLYLGRDTYRQGAVGLALSGEIAVDTVVAQGCRPIGEPRRVTRCQDNILLELDGQPPIAYLRDLYPKLPERDQALVNGNLFLGIAIDPLLSLDEADLGDFLIRNLVGADPERGILAVGENLREGQLVQFHVRDALASAEDLQRQLARYLSATERRAAAGALLFQCNGRGAHLYGKPNHDSDLFKQIVGPVPLGGFFCNGEIGQVSGATYLHGYTSSFALFRRP